MDGMMLSFAIEFQLEQALKP